MDKDMEYIILEDNIEYMVTEKIKEQDKEYVYLTNPENPKDFCIRKLLGKVLFGLDSLEEYNFAMNLLKNKHSSLLTKIGL